MSMKTRLFILVEGGDDVRFFGRIVKPLFSSNESLHETLSAVKTKLL
jgi:hypothetical protein